MPSKPKVKRSRQLTVAFLTWLFLLSTGSLQAQRPLPPKPGPEHKKMEAWVGEWRYAGSTKETPAGPAGTFAGKQTCRMILNGFFLEYRWREKGQYEGKEVLAQGVDIQGFDAATKNYFDQGFENDGTVNSGILNVHGNTWTGTATRTDTQGKLYRTKFVTNFSTDGKTCTTKSEISADDGKIWMPWWELTMQQVRR